MQRQELIKNTKLVVIKIGTSTITFPDGKIDIKQIDNLASQVSLLKKKGLNIILVTSGAIGAGVAELGLNKRPDDVSDLQACAAVGQGRLMETYSQAFKKKNYISAQVLLTSEDLRSRKRFLNARNTMLKLLERNVVPVVNENDTVAVDEIKFGDNDKLSALVTNLVQADLLIVLSDVDGLYDRNKEVIDRIQHINKDIEDLCCGKGSILSTGGMRTKLDAAKMVMRAGEAMIVTNGRKADVLEKIFNGETTGTFFEPHGKGLNAKKRWLAFFTKTHGIIAVDKGAEEALVKRGKSLLASGIISVKGNFKAGDPVNISNNDGKRIACGLVNYSSDEVEKIKGLKTSQMSSILGYKMSDEVIHRNNMSVNTD